MNYYKILNIKIFSSFEDIIKAYENIKNKTSDIEKAYTILINYNSRKEYDQQLLKNDKINNNYYYDKQTIRETDNNIQNLLININKRLEKIENKLENNFTNYYKESKIINNIIKKNGKTTSIKTIINDNGKKNTFNKVMFFDNKSKLIKSYNN